MDLSAARGHRPPHASLLRDVAPADALAAWLAELAREGALAERGAEACSLADAAGRVTAGPVQARHADPIARCAAMDGIAVRAMDTANATELHPVTLGPGRFAPVDTGQPIPAGFDAVIPREQLDRCGDEVRVFTSVAGGRHIRRAGENVAEGSTVLEAGRRLTAYDIALLQPAAIPRSRSCRALGWWSCRPVTRSGRSGASSAPARRSMRTA